MSYAPPSGSGIQFRQGAGYSAPSGSSIPLAWPIYGAGDGIISVVGAGVGGLPVAGTSASELSVVAEAYGSSPPCGKGVSMLFSELVSGTGYVATFGSASAQVRFNKFATGLLVPLGAGATGNSVISAQGTGSGGAVLCLADCGIGIAGAGTGTLDSTSVLSGTGKGYVRFAAQGAGITARMGIGAAKVSIVGAAVAARGVVASGSAKLAFGTNGAGVRGATSAGDATIKLKGHGYGARGNTTSGTAQVQFSVIGSGTVVFLTTGSVDAHVHIEGLGFGEIPREPDNSDAHVFVRTALTHLYFREAA